MPTMVHIGSTLGNPMSGPMSGTPLPMSGPMLKPCFLYRTRHWVNHNQCRTQCLRHVSTLDPTLGLAEPMSDPMCAIRLNIGPDIGLATTNVGANVGDRPQPRARHWVGHNQCRRAKAFSRISPPRRRRCLLLACPAHRCDLLVRFLTRLGVLRGCCCYTSTSCYAESSRGSQPRAVHAHRRGSGCTPRRHRTGG